MKKLLSIVLAVLLVVSIIPLSAIPASADTYSGICGDNLYCILDTATGTLTISGTGDMYSYNFESAPWYSFGPYIKSVKFSEGVTSIGDSAFIGCDITSITIPDSVTSIGEYAFTDCSSLTSITLPESLTSIGAYAFFCTGYYNDSSNWENGVLYIGNYLIKAGESISGEYTVREGITLIADDAFERCGSLTSITLPESLTSIGRYAFNGCGSLKSITVASGNTVYHSAGNCLIETATKELISGCKNSVIPTDGSVTSIGSYAFFECYSLTSITIPESVTSIGEYAFTDCSSLTSITLPESLTSIGLFAFNDTAYYWDTTNWENGVLYIGNYLIKAGESISGEYTVRDGTTLIADRAFLACSSLTSITLPESLTSIGDLAFCYCSSLTSITIPDSVTSIGSRAFYDCSSLTSITIPASVTSIGDSAFFGCRKMKMYLVENSFAYTFAVENKIPYVLMCSCGSCEIEYRSSMEPTCEAEGYQGDIYCLNCGTYLRDGKILSAIGHNYKSNVTVAPKYLQNGLEANICERCDESTENVLYAYCDIDENGVIDNADRDNLMSNKGNAENIKLFDFDNSGAIAGFDEIIIEHLYNDNDFNQMIDVTGDGKTDLKDLVRAIKILVGKSDKGNADCNLDGATDARDLTFILSFILYIDHKLYI